MTAISLAGRGQYMDAGVMPFLKHPACGSALKSLPQAGPVSSHDLEVIR